MEELKMKKIVSMLLMMVLAISVLTGCSDTDKARQLEVRQALGFTSRAQLGRWLAIAGLGLLQWLASFARLGAPDFHPELLAQLIQPGFLRRRLEFHGGSDGHRGFGLHLLDAG